MRFIVYPIRAILVLIYWTILCLGISLYFLIFKYRDKNNLYRVSSCVKFLLKPLYGIDCYVQSKTKELPKTAVYVSNHQNTMDIVILAKALQIDTVTVGKKQLASIPVFGWMYWLSGNILLDKSVAVKALKTIDFVVSEIKKKKLSVWLFPEGTRSYGRYELADFKPGAFLTAIEAGVPIIPIVVSDLNKFDMGKLNNGKVIISYLEPIKTEGLTRRQAKDLAAYVEKLFLEEYRRLNKLVAENKDDTVFGASKIDFQLTPNENWGEGLETPSQEFLKEEAQKLAELRSAEKESADQEKAPSQEKDVKEATEVSPK